MAKLTQNASHLCPKYADLRFCSTEFVVSIRVLKFNESATAYIMEWSAHVPWMNISDRYSTHDLFRLLSINRSGLSLKYWTAAVLISR